MSSQLKMTQHGAEESGKTAPAVKFSKGSGPIKKSEKASEISKNGSAVTSSSKRKIPKLLSTRNAKSVRTGDDVIKSLKWVIFPDNKYIKTWDLVVLAGLFLLAFILPYQIGVSGGVSILIKIPWFVFNVFLNAIFFVDTFLYFFRAYYTPNGHLVLDLKKIRRHYLTTYFVPNFLSVLPYTLAFFIVGTKYLNAEGEPDPAVSSFLTFITFASILKLIRLVRAKSILASSDIVSGFRMKRNSQMLELWKYVWLIVAVSHWFACIWSFVAFVEADNFRAEALLLRTNWIGFWYENNETDGGLNPLGWERHVDRYILSLFWAIQTITSIGYGNIVPVTRAEYFVACSIQLCVGVMWAYVIGGLVGVAAGMQVRAETYRTRIDQANELIHNFQDPVEDDTHDDDKALVGFKSKQVARDLRKYIHNQYIKSHGESCICTIPAYYPVFDTLTPELQKASSVLLADQYLQTVPYLSSKYMNQSCQSIVAMKTVILEFASGETIHTENAVQGLGRGIFVFKSGCAFNLDKAIEQTDVGKKLEDLRLVTAGMAYGEDKVLLEDDNEYAKGQMEFLTFSQVVFLPRDAILEALKKSEKAWKDSARWIYLRTLIESKLHQEGKL